MNNNKMRSYVLSLFVPLMLTFANTTKASPPGWTVVSEQGGTTISERKVMKTTLRGVVSPWFDHHSRSPEAWLNENKYRNSLNDRVERGKVKIRHNKASIFVMRNLRDRDHLSLLAVCDNPAGKIRAIDVSTAARLFQQRDVINTVVSFVQYHCKQRQPTPSSTSSVPNNKEPMVKPSSIKSLDDLKELRGVITYGLQAGGMFGPTSDVIALFNDGSYTNDLANSFGESVKASRQQSPKSWGQWRIRNGELELKSYRDQAFDKTSGNWLAIPGTKNQKLSDCYTQRSSSNELGMGGSTAGKVKTICFNQQGRFSFDEVAFKTASGGGVAGAASERAPNRNGTYTINGYIIKLRYDSGEEIQAAFSFINEDKTHITINDRRFMD